MATTPVELDATLAEALAQPTLCAAFQLTAAARGDAPALVLPDGAVHSTWSQYAQRVRAVAEGLASLGVGAGDTVALMLTNRPEFYIADTAALHLRAIPFSVYNTNPPEQIVPLLANSGARVMITESQFLERVLAAQAAHPSLERVIVVDGEDSLEALGTAAGFDFDASWRAAGEEDVITIVYTSGTTGEPKGVQHTHSTLTFGLRSMYSLCPVSPGGRVVSFLPMAHIAERYVSHYGSLVFGYAITCVPDHTKLAPALASTRPTRLFGVPRIYEKLWGAVTAMADAEPGGPLARAIAAGTARVRAEQAGEPAPELSDADAAVLAGVRAKLGLDAIEWAGVAAAPSPYAMLEFFHAIGVPLAELWGMSECLLSTSNPMHRIKLGTIGYALPGVEVTLADDGEILVRGPNVMRAYRGRPEQTRAAIDADGWLYTGDIAVADDDGYLRIVDRKKELIINSAGKNMAPSKIELAIKEQSPLIAQVVAIGDGRPYVTALIVLDPDACGGLDIATAAGDARVREQVAAAVAAGNGKLARVEQIKTHTILPVAWQPGGDELTPTMKLKRRVIAERYAEEIDALYAPA